MKFSPQVPIDEYHVALGNQCSREGGLSSGLKDQYEVSVFGDNLDRAKNPLRGDPGPARCFRIVLLRAPMKARRAGA